MEDLKTAIARNIADLRKSRNWTQAELAQKLNYSDKAVSKWERAESVPDVTVLKEIVDLFQVSMDYLVEAEHAGPADAVQTVTRLKKRNRLIIALLSVSLVFLIATTVFVCLELYCVRVGPPPWMVYLYALPVADVVLLVFNSIWGRKRTNFLIITVLVWSLLLDVYLSFPSWNMWLIFLIGIPAQFIILLWANLKHKGK